ncbi:hypothetical protein SAMN02745196_01184 [Clostridium collagenovorans DSM 3089]|uniref:Uncharacterized protein n=1 Tax=Clostridium collagenovorans DSM 3089 TaxID=1121306 RepID=A0A1M5V9T3_9CLOT|nr:hypothetical protein [Clostridium collagenovorans]SHH71908.1 hypothetical protein SAMN02745196_01184 [Clostridium collagenovorans DSM 3089]
MFDVVWKNIIFNKGKTFVTKSNIEFKYKVKGNDIIPYRTNYPLNKNDFKKAYNLLPLDGPGKINNIVRGPAYV